MNPGISSRADFFKELPREIVWEAGGGKHLEVSPKHVVTQNLSAGGPIIFNLPYVYKGSYNFSQSYIKFKLKINSNPENAIGDNEVFGANGIGHTVWKNIELFAGGIPLHTSFQEYGYKKIVEHLLTSEQNNANHDEMWGYTKRLNAPGNNLNMDTNRDRVGFNADNPLKNADWVEFIIYPNLDFFNNKNNVLCLDTVKWELRLTPQDMRHCLNWSCDYGGILNPVADGLAASLARNFHIDIDPASVKYYLKVDMFSDEAYSGIMEAGRVRGFVYNYTPTTIIAKTITAGERMIEDVNFTPRANPLMYAHTFVCHDGYLGHKKRNPFLFRPPPNLRRISNWFNGELIGEQSPVRFEAGNATGLKQLYINNLNGLEIEEYDHGLTWSYSDMARGIFFKVVSLRPSSESLDLVPMTKPGMHTYRVELSAEEPIAYTCLTYTQYEPAQVTMYLDGTVTNSFLI